MYESFHNAGLFLINTLFNLYLAVLVVRLILAYARADYFNPITRFVINATQPIVKPVRAVLPNYAGIEFSTLVIIIVLEALKNVLISLLASGIPGILPLLIFSVRDTLLLVLNAFFYAIFFHAVLSWIQPGYSPLGQVLQQLSDPVMRPLRRLIPLVGGFDLTPIPALIIIELLIILI